MWRFIPAASTRSRKSPDVVRRGTGPAVTRKGQCIRGALRNFCRSDEFTRTSKVTPSR